MISDIEFKGVWYLPSRPRRRVPGRIKFTPGENPLLELDGSLEPGDEDFPEMVDFQIVLGVSDNGKPITLYRCHQNRSRGSQFSAFIVRFVFVGAHFKSDAELSFKRIHVQYQHLEQWSKISGFNRKVRGAKHEHIISYTEPEPFVVASTDDYKIEVAAFSLSDITITEANIREKHVVRMCFSQQKSFSECLDFARIFQNFLTIAVGNVIFPLMVEVQRDTVRIRNRKVVNMPVEVYYNPTRTYKEWFIISEHMLFTLENIKENANEYLKRWYERHETLKPVFVLYFSILYSPFTYVTNDFLNLAQAIETYHRRVYGGKYQDDETFRHGLYETLVNALPTTLPADFRTSLVKGKLKYANEYSLRKRLNDLLKQRQDSLPSMGIDDSTSRVAFVEKVVETRNYLTHYDEHSEAKDDEPLILIALETKLRLILEACLLGEIGFDNEAVRAMLTKSSTYYSLQSLESK